MHAYNSEYHLKFANNSPLKIRDQKNINQKIIFEQISSIFFDEYKEQKFKFSYQYVKNTERRHFV
jgi:hypothetical protein